MADAFETAKSFHQAGRLAEAEAGYRAVLDSEPENADVLNMLGNVLADQQRWQEAADSYRRAVAARPDKAAAHYNLGNALSALDLLRDAVQAYQQAIALRPDYAKAHFNLGNVLFDLGQLSDAAGCYRQALDADPGHPDAAALYNLARTLHRQGQASLAIPFYRKALQFQPRFHSAYGELGMALLETGKPQEAIRCHQRALELDPDEPAAHFYSGRTLLTLLQFDAAEAAFRRTLELDPQSNDAYRALGQVLDASGRQSELPALAEAWLRARPGDPEAIHYQTAWTGSETPRRASDDFVRATFDGFAEDFDAIVQTLNYRVPQLLHDALSASLESRGATLAILDAGCGTGLCGPLLRGWAARLVGVDLSAGMLDRARRRQTYDELVEGELTAYLQQSPEAFDVIVSADTLVYFGDLDPVLSAAAEALKADGCLAFTLEILTAAEPDAAYGLQSHGRFSHSEDYVRGRLSAHGLEVDKFERVILRAEGGRDVHGLLVLANKPR
ncbi:MAG: tetratricopeptide repeat protein [Pirellulaceae bacterium]|nr:tetratricopeptide repeat protein [Pirellulaceae bacterium]